MNDFFWVWMSGFWKDHWQNVFRLVLLVFMTAMSIHKCRSFRTTTKSLTCLLMNLIGFTAKSYSCTPSNLQKPHKSILAALRHRWFRGQNLMAIEHGVFLRPTSFVPICPCPHLWVPMQKSSALAADPWISTSPGKRTIPSHDVQSPLPTQSGHFLMRSHSEMNPVKHAKLILVPGWPLLLNCFSMRSQYEHFMSASVESTLHKYTAPELNLFQCFLGGICNIPPAQAAR